MGRYSVDVERLVRQFTPHWLGGRRTVLFLQAAVWPMQALADVFGVWAREKRVEATMTSQVFKLEWFLNSRFGAECAGRITISHDRPSGTVFYPQSEAGKASLAPLVGEEPGGPAIALRAAGEEAKRASASFAVCVPGDPDEGLAARIAYWVERYRLAGKTYTINFTQ